MRSSTPPPASSSLRLMCVAVLSVCVCVLGLGSPNYANMLSYVKSGKHIAHKRTVSKSVDNMPGWKKL